MHALPDRPRRELAAGIAIAAAAAAVFARTLGAGFVWDDHGLVESGRLLRGPLSAIWLGAGKDYWPLTFTSFWVEWRVWGKAPAGYHAVNVALHAAASVLLWRALRALRVPGAWLAGLLFAVHPVTVESVAWISERKNVLSAVPFLGAVLCWVRWLDARRALHLALALALFSAALLAKTSAVPLPVVLLAVAWLRAGRLERRDVLATLPFVALALAGGLVTVAFQHGEAMVGEVAIARSAADRIGGAAWAALTYLRTALVPVRLAVLYPPWPADPGALLFWMPLAGLVAAAALLALLRDRGGKPWLLALGYHTAMVAPVLGLVDMAFLAAAPASNHLQYLPLMGPAALGAYGLERLRARSRWGAAAAGAVALLLAASTARRAGAFENDLALWTAAVHEAPSSPSARYQLAMVLLGAGRAAEGVDELQAMAAVAREPGRRALAEMLAAFHAGRGAEAASRARALLAGNPSLELRREAAVILLAAGDPERGISELRELVARAPSATDYVYHLAGALARAGRLTEAADVLLAHVRRWPGDPELEQAAAFVLLRLGRPREALERAAAAAGAPAADPRAAAQLDAWRTQAGWRQ